MAVNTWIKAEAGLWSEPTNWSLGRVPIDDETYDDVATFDITSVNNCSANSTQVCYGLNMNAGYSGTVTQACEVTITGDCTIAAGTLTGDATNPWNVGGDFICSDSGMVTSSKLILVMNGEDATLSLKIQRLISLTINANITATCSNDVTFSIAKNIIIASEKTVTIAENKVMQWQGSYGGGTLTNNSIIAGPGTFKYLFYSSDHSVVFGTITAPVIIQLDVGGSGSKVATLSATASLGSTLTILSSHATYTITLDTNGHNLSCTDLTLGNRGIVDLGEGTHTFAGNFDGVGTGSDVIPGTSTVILTGASAIVELQAADSFYNLVTTAGAHITLASDITVENELVKAADNIALDGHTLTHSSPDKLYDRHRIHHEAPPTGVLKALGPGDLILDYLADPLAMDVEEASA